MEMYAQADGRLKQIYSDAGMPRDPAEKPIGRVYHRA